MGISIGKTDRRGLKETVKKNVEKSFDKTSLNKMIQDRAYYIWEEKGKPSANDYEIWLQAEREILSKVK